jgi:hypothetical protein
MSYEPDAARPRARADESQAPSHDGAKTVRADDHGAPQLTRRAVAGLDDDTAYALVVVAHQVYYPGAFLDARAGVLRASKENVIQNRSSQREPAVSESRESLHTRELGVDGFCVRCAEMHPRQLRGARRFDFLEHAHVRKYSRRLRTQVLGAYFVARKTRTIDHEDVDTGCGKRPRRRSTGRPATHDYYVGVAIAARQLTARDTR